MIAPPAAGPAVPVVSRAVVDQLDAWISETKGEIAAADAKASTLLGWSGTGFALLTGLLASSTRTAGVVLIPAGIGVVALGGCVIVLILAVRPRMGGGSHRSFLHHAALTGHQLVELAVQDGQPVLDAVPTAGRLANLSRMACRKYRYVRAATTLLLIAMPALAIAAGAGVLR